MRRSPPILVDLSASPSLGQFLTECRCRVARKVLESSSKCRATNVCLCTATLVTTDLSQGRASMKFLIAPAIAVSVLAFASAAQAQGQGRLFFEGDVIRGNQPGAPFAPCVLNNRFQRLEKV